jgi:K+/H+ antiporter YhaU regulatory subunit KhtT
MDGWPKSRRPSFPASEYATSSTPTPVNVLVSSSIATADAKWSSTTATIETPAQQWSFCRRQTRARWLSCSAPAIGATIRDGEYRTRTGASIVAVIRGDQSVPAPDPEFDFQIGDTAVAVGTTEGLALLRDQLTN